jgi:phosphatidylserine/phosphatidylglycerophosphate/cardiolipin synthase-like enzyme
MRIFRELRPEALRELATALRTAGSWTEWTPAELARMVPREVVESVSGEIARLAGEGLQCEQVAEVVEALAQARDDGRSVGDRIDLVWTGPEGPGTVSRDTAVVVREAFNRADSRVLVAGYVVYQGQEVFSALARRMLEVPDLRVRLFLNIERRRGDTSLASEIVRRFAREFVGRQWPGGRLPEVFYDPRSLEVDAQQRAVLHAKCIVIDGVTAFVSSANFTPAAQARNIEVGALIRSASFAGSLESHFESLVEVGALLPVELR